MALTMVGRGKKVQVDNSWRLAAICARLIKTHGFPLSGCGSPPPADDSRSVDRRLAGIDAEALFSGYPGPAILVEGAGGAVAANAPARKLLEGSGGCWEELVADGFARPAEGAGGSAEWLSHLERPGGLVVLAWTPVELGSDRRLLLGRDATADHRIRQRLQLATQNASVEQDLRETLTESRQRYKDLVEISSNFAWETDAKGAFAFVSPAGALGWRPDDLIGRKPNRILFTDDDLPSPFETRRPLERVELWMRAADGSSAYLEVSAKPLFNAKGRWCGARGVCRDLTEQVTRANEVARLRNLDVALSRISAVLREGVSSGDPFTACARETVRALSATGCVIFASAEETPGREALVPVAECRMPGDRSDVVFLLDRALASPGVVTGEESGCNGLAAAIRYPSGLNGVIAVWHSGGGGGEWDEDAVRLIAGVAERIAIIHAQIAYQERLSAILHTVVDGILTIDTKGIVRTVNPAAAAMFGYGPDEIVGREVGILMPELLSGIRDRLFAPTAGGGGGSGREVEGRRKDGGVFPVELTLGRMAIAGAVMFTAVVRDISERRQIERMKEEFISTVSHELRTPLTAIRTSLSLINAGVMGDVPEEALEMTVIAEESCERLGRLINDILDVEKISSGQLQLEMERISLVEAVERALADTRMYAERFGVALSPLITLEGASIEADFDRVVQVVANLISNACKFSPEGETVTVTVGEGDAGRVRVSIADRGPGIAEQFRERIFGKFAQADASDAKVKGGTGLGLNIAKGLVERMGGRIWFDTAVGAGTVFHFDFPLLPQ